MTQASLAAAVVGVGVNIAGFALVLRRLHQVQNDLASVRSESVAARLATERLETRTAVRDWPRIENLLQLGEEGWVRSDATSVWKDLDGAMDLEQRYWRGLVGGTSSASILLDTHFTADQGAAAYDAVLTLASARIQTLLLLDELAAGPADRMKRVQNGGETM